MNPGPPGAPTRGADDLPAGLWLGTAVFAVLAAGGLFLSMRLGRSAIVDSANPQIEKAAVTAKDRSGAEAPEPAAPAAPDPREAAEHWEAGLAAYNSGDRGKARDEWTLCRQLDSQNASCGQALAQLDAAAAPVSRRPR